MILACTPLCSAKVFTISRPPNSQCKLAYICTVGISKLLSGSVTNHTIIYWQHQQHKDIRLLLYTQLDYIVNCPVFRFGDNRVQAFVFSETQSETSMNKMQAEELIVHYVRIYNGSKPPRTRAKPLGQGCLRLP